jgi:hypothetical protein
MDALYILVRLDGVKSSHYTECCQKNLHKLVMVRAVPAKTYHCRARPLIADSLDLLPMPQIFNLGIQRTAR